MCNDKLLSVIIFCPMSKQKNIYIYKFIIAIFKSNQITRIYKIFIVSAEEKFKLWRYASIVKGIFYFFKIIFFFYIFNIFSFNTLSLTQSFCIILSALVDKTSNNKLPSSIFGGSGSHLMHCLYFKLLFLAFL